MTDEPLAQDPGLRDALRSLEPGQRDAADWDRLRRGINIRASSELARRRAQHRRRAAAMGIGLAAGLLLFLVTWQTPQTARATAAGVPYGRVTTTVSTDELLDADVSDAEFRAWLSGAANADELLRIAAEETNAAP